MMIFALKYWREILIGIALCLLVAGAAYVKHVFAERDRLQTENSLLKKDLESAAKMQQLTNKISDAISQIKIRSTVNVSKIESEPKPVFVDNSRPVVLIPGGMLQAMYSSGSSGRATTGNETGGNMAAGKPKL